VRCSVVLREKLGKKRRVYGEGLVGPYNLPNNRIFVPKIKTHHRTGVDRTSSHLPQVPKWNHQFSCPR